MIPVRSIETWKWAVGLLVSVLLALCGAAVANVTFELHSQDARLLAVEKAVAVYQTKIDNIDAGVTELKTLVRDYLKARP